MRIQHIHLCHYEHEARFGNARPERADGGTNMNSMIYKKKAPLLFFLLPAFLFLIVYLYYPFIQNVINSFLSISGLGTKAFSDGPWASSWA